jgi:hypothetical protein
MTDRLVRTPLKTLTVLLGLFALAACSSISVKLPSIGADKPVEIAEDFFEVYRERQDFEALMGFYAEEAQLEDLIYGHFAEDKASIRAFLNWNDNKFELPNGPPALEVTSLTAQSSRVVAQGYFKPFSYDGKSFGPWRFVIILEFNDDGKIVREIDWINYTPRENFLGGKDINTLGRVK